MSLLLNWFEFELFEDDLWIFIFTLLIFANLVEDIARKWGYLDEEQEVVN